MPYVFNAVRLGGPCVPVAPNARGEPPRHRRTAAWVKATIGAVGSSALLGALPLLCPGGGLPCGQPAGSRTRPVGLAVPFVLNALCLECLMP